MMYRSAFENVLFLGTLGRLSRPLFSTTYLAASLSESTLSIMVTLEDCIVFIGTGSGFFYSQSYLFDVAEREKPINILVTDLCSRLTGLGSALFLSDIAERITLYMPGAWRDKLVDPHYEDKHIRLILDGKIAQSKLKLGTSSVYQVVGNVGEKWSGKVIASQCVLWTSKQSSCKKKVLAFRIGDTLFAPCGRLIDRKVPSKACLTLLKGIKHLVTNCSGVRPRTSSSCLEGNTPEEIVKACKAAGCAPDIYLINRYPNDEDAYEVLRSLYKESIPDGGIVFLASDESIL